MSYVPNYYGQDYSYSQYASSIATEYVSVLPTEIYIEEANQSDKHSPMERLTPPELGYYQSENDTNICSRTSSVIPNTSIELKATNSPSGT